VNLLKKFSFFLSPTYVAAAGTASQRLKPILSKAFGGGGGFTG
jgi:hypothetical protein